MINRAENEATFLQRGIS